MKIDRQRKEQYFHFKEIKFQFNLQHILGDNLTIKLDGNIQIKRRNKLSSLQKMKKKKKCMQTGTSVTKRTIFLASHTKER